MSPNNDDDQTKLQGYQDDFDTSQRDQVVNEAQEDSPLDSNPATRAEFSQGLRDSATDEQGNASHTDEPHPDDSEPPLASSDDYREDVEDRDEDDKERSEPRW